MLVYGVLAIPAAALFSRLYWILLNLESFSDEPLNAVFNWNGDVGLYGAFIGCIIVACFVGRIEKIRPALLLDALSPGAALAVSVGRLADYYGGKNFGSEVQSAVLQIFPISVYAPDFDSWFYAVFVYESAFCLAASIILLHMENRLYTGKNDKRIPGGFVPDAEVMQRSEYAVGRNMNQSSSAGPAGDIFLWFLLIYGCGRTVFESMRADGIYVGFVKPAQVVSFLLALAIFIYFSVHAVRRRGAKASDYACWLLAALSAAAAFWAEFCKGADSYMRNTLILAAAMLSILVLSARFHSSRSS